jgi:hypothetical protein
MCASKPECSRVQVLDMPGQGSGDLRAASMKAEAKLCAPYLMEKTAAMERSDDFGPQTALRVLVVSRSPDPTPTCSIRR